MAFIQCDFFSEVLGLSCSMNVVLPQQTTRQVGLDGKATREWQPTLYLLHGWSDDHTIWMRRTSVERYAAAYGLAIVMPAVNKSCYTNMKYGPDYWEFISEEVPAVARQFFRLSDKREDNFAAGLSMGGHGAFKLALTCSETFSAAGSFSGALKSDWEREERSAEWFHIFGDEPSAGTGDDMFHLARELKESGKPIPRLYQSCGTEDFLYGDNVAFRKHIDELGIEMTTDFRPGTHEWGFWDTDIRKFLEWLGVPA